MGAGALDRIADLMAVLAPFVSSFTSFFHFSGPLFLSLSKLRGEEKVTLADSPDFPRREQVTYLNGVVMPDEEEEEEEEEAADDDDNDNEEGDEEGE